LHEKLTPWDSFTKEIYDIAQEVEAKSHKSPVIVPLDTYNIASELSFYQQKYLNQKKITSSFKVIGSHVFGLNSLMYQYWGDIDEAKGNTVILISQNMTPFSYPQVNQHVISLSPIKSVEYQGKNDKSLLFYYKIIKLA
jgi:dolichol-phosphate mannosyltransferase